MIFKETNSTGAENYTKLTSLNNLTPTERLSSDAMPDDSLEEENLTAKMSTKKPSLLKG